MGINKETHTKFSVDRKEFLDGKKEGRKVIRNPGVKKTTLKSKKAHSLLDGNPT